MKKSQVEIKVKAVNLLNKFAKTIFEYEQEYFSQFMGKNVFKVNGSIKEKYKHEHLEISGKDDGDFYIITYYFDNRASFDINITVCLSGGSYDVNPVTAFCLYEKSMHSMFKLDRFGAITEKCPIPKELNDTFDITELNKIAGNIKLAAGKYKSEVETMPYVFRSVYDIERLHRY